MYINEDNKLFGLSKYAKILILFTGLLIGLIISRIFFFTPFKVQDNSMNPGLKKGDYILICKILTPEEGDIVLLKSPVEPGAVILKRLIAKGEKTIEIKNKILFIDNMKHIFKWDTHSIDKRIFRENFSQRDNLPARKIKKGEIFVIGDNLDYSFDSRSFGAIDENLVIGKMIYKF